MYQTFEDMPDGVYFFRRDRREHWQICRIEGDGFYLDNGVKLWGRKVMISTASKAELKSARSGKGIFRRLDGTRNKFDILYDDSGLCPQYRDSHFGYIRDVYGMNEAFLYEIGRLIEMGYPINEVTRHAGCVL